METDQQLEQVSGKDAAHTQTATQMPKRAVRERRRPKVAAVPTVANPSSPALKVEQSVTGWNDAAVRLSAALVGLILGALALTALIT